MMLMLAKLPEPLNLELIAGRTGSIINVTGLTNEVAAKINKEEDEVRVAHLLNIIGKDAQDLYETFTLSEDGRKDITKVLY